MSRNEPGAVNLPSKFRPLKFVFLIAATVAHAEPIAPASISVTDGDTIEVSGQRIRLVGFDTPETGPRARCQRESELGNAATARLQQIVRAGNLALAFIPCACRAGTEGTKACNHGRACAVLSSNGRDVGAILIGEGLARPYVCTGTRCPRRQSWCGL